MLTEFAGKGHTGIGFVVRFLRRHWRGRVCTAPDIPRISAGLSYHGHGLAGLVGDDVEVKIAGVVLGRVAQFAAGCEQGKCSFDKLF